MKKKIVAIFLAIAAVIAVGFTTACQSKADVVSHNLSKEADNFKVLRRIVFYNGITGQYILVIEGYCSLGNHDPAGKLSVTCKTGEHSYKKHFLGLSDNVTFFEEQLDGVNVSPNHYQVVFRPTEILPQPEIR
jgi:hypothetical protein